MINQEDIIDYLFQQVEQNNLEQVKRTFECYPELKQDPKRLRAQNGWNPDLFAARFGYTKMLMFFLEEIYNEKRRISDLVLLNIHSGSLKTMYYLHEKADHKFHDEDMIHFYQNSFKLDKRPLCLYFMLRDLYIIETRGDQTFYHNIYPIIEEGGEPIYYKQSKKNLKGDTPVRQDQITRIVDKEIQSFSALKQKLNIFNYDLMKNLIDDHNIEEKEEAPIKWKQIFEILNNTSQIQEKIKKFLNQFLIMLNENEIQYLITKSQKQFLKLSELKLIFENFECQKQYLLQHLNIKLIKNIYTLYLGKNIHKFDKDISKNNNNKKRKIQTLFDKKFCIKYKKIRINSNQQLQKRVYKCQSLPNFKIKHNLYKVYQKRYQKLPNFDYFKESNFNKILYITPKYVEICQKTKLYIVLKQPLQQQNRQKL